MHRGAGLGWYDRPSLENTAILLWETGGCRVGNIRGVIASASLKRRTTRRLEEAPGHIRGVIASASLKPEDHVVALSQCGTYPRRYRLGLIEAAHIDPLCDQVGLISEALSPRPH